MARQQVNALSLFSGAGGMDLGLHRAGITTTTFCEIDPRARSVLARHWPGVPIVEDVRNVDRTVGTPDLVHGGFPCQDVSLAGRRRGMAGERSGLWWEFHRILSELRPAWCLIENVVGLLSSNGGRDMGAILGALGDLGYGFAYRVLDARYFGVPQRRRRVFIVGHLGDRRSAQILLEPEGGEGNPEAVGEAGTGIAAESARRTDKYRRDEFVGSLTGMDGWERPDNAHAEAGWLRVENHPIAPLMGTVMTTFDSKNYSNLQEVTSGSVVAINENRQGELRVSDVTPTLSTGGGKPGQGYQAVLSGLAVRRLTPEECEALMGWPKFWTRWAADGSEIADTSRYRMCGNGVVAPVAEWLGRRIMEASS